MRKQLFKFHATRQNIIKMFLIKFQEYFEKMYSCSGAFSLFFNRVVGPEKPTTLIKGDSNTGVLP